MSRKRESEWDIDIDYRPCAACGRMAYAPESCECCEIEREVIGGAVQLYCVDCRCACTSCKKDVCENHQRASGECIACSGPTDGELRAWANQGDGYSSESMARVREIGR
jgi:hypothetical protein